MKKIEHWGESVLSRIHAEIRLLSMLRPGIEPPKET